MEVIYSYTREQALEDGVLVDVTELAQEAGFRIPVAVTRALWDGYVVPNARQRNAGQSTTGRLWDVLFMLLWEIQAGAQHTSSILFRGIFDKKEVELKALCHPGDNMEPVITIMFPCED